MINLIVKKFILDKYAAADEDEDEEDADIEDINAKFGDTMRTVRKICKEISSSTDLQERLKTAQTLNNADNEPLKIVLENQTRWNSMLSMLLRFKELEHALCFICDLSSFDWNILDELINILLPLQECTDDLQRNGANVDTASTILTYLKQEAAASATIGGPISTVFNKWIITNPIAHAIMYNEGTFYDYIKRKKTGIDVDPSDHVYTPQRRSYKDIKRNSVTADNFCLFTAIDSFVPGSVDPERLFSWGRLSKNWLQAQLSPENHSRNVFLNKNTRFVY